MRTKFPGSWKVVLVLASLPLIVGALQYPPADEASPAAPSSDDPPPAVVTHYDPGVIETNLAVNNLMAGAITNARPSEPSLPDMKLYGGTAEVVKLAQSGVGEDVMLTYITNTSARFALGPDQIIYLNDLGVSGSVVTAMIQHDTALDMATTVPPATPAVPATQPDTGGYPATQMAEQPVPTTGTEYVDSNIYPPDYGTGGDADYFYDSLAPYGSWQFVPNFGLCWQPVTYVRNHDWRPYDDRGRWLYTDCGWYWQSDYSWGWAAFHYGRWFRDPARGWLWAPNRVWGPAWVAWRNSGEYCGWAPLPPSAHFVPGLGFRFQNRAVSATFDFGIGRGLFTFVPTERLGDYTPGRYRATGAMGARIWGESAVINSLTAENQRIFNHGVNPSRVEKLSGVPVRHAYVRDMAPSTGNGRVQPDRVEKRGDNFVVFRPHLPDNPTRHVDARTSPSTSASSTTSTRPVNAPSAPIVLPPRPGTAPAVPSVNQSTVGANGASSSRIQIFSRHDAPATGPSTATATAPTGTANPPARGNRADNHAPNSLILTGGRNQSDATTPTTVSTPQPVTSPRPFQPRGPVSERVTLLKDPNLQADAANFPSTPSPRSPGSFDNNGGRNFGRQGQDNPGRFGGQPNSTPSQPASQSPLPPPGHGGTTFGGSPNPSGGHSSSSTFSPRAAGSTPAPSYTPPSQPLLLPPSHMQSAPTPAPAPSYHAPAPAPAPAPSSSHSSGSQSPGSQSSGSQSSGRGR